MRTDAMPAPPPEFTRRHGRSGEHCGTLVDCRSSGPGPHRKLDAAKIPPPDM